MYGKILVPVDLSHITELKKALDTAADLAKQYNAEVIYVSVTANMPTPEGRNLAEFTQKLEAFAAEERERHGRPTAAHAVESHDPAIELERILLSTASQLGIDLIVMATHAPGLFEGLRTHHGAHLASQTSASIFLVR